MQRNLTGGKVESSDNSAMRQNQRLEVRRIDAGTEDFDLEFWQAEGPAAIFRAAWELVETAWVVKGKSKDELRLQRTARVTRQI